MTVVFFSMAYRSFRGGSGRLDTRLDTPPSINRRHPDFCLAPSRSREPGPLWFRLQVPRAPPVFVFAEALLTSAEEARHAWAIWSAGVPCPACCTRGRVRDLAGFLATHPTPLPCSKPPAEPTT